VFIIVFKAVGCCSLVIVGVAAPSERLAGPRVVRELVLLSNLAGLCIVKSFIAVKAETYSKWLEPRKNSPVFAIAHYLFLSHSTQLNSL